LIVVAAVQKQAAEPLYSKAVHSEATEQVTKKRWTVSAYALEQAEDPGAYA
jgi:hypothetical protein